jgi:hypothetical protein
MGIWPDLFDFFVSSTGSYYYRWKWGGVAGRWKVFGSSLIFDLFREAGQCQQIPAGSEVKILDSTLFYRQEKFCHMLLVT